MVQGVQESPPRRATPPQNDKLCSTPDSGKRGGLLEGSPNFQALFRDLPDLTPPRAKMSYSNFTGASPSTSEFGFPRLGMPDSQSPDRQRLGFDLLQRSTPVPATMMSPTSRSGLGMPPLPIFHPSPLRGLQNSGFPGGATNGVNGGNGSVNGTVGGVHGVSGPAQGNVGGHQTGTNGMAGKNNDQHPVLSALNVLNSQGMSQSSTFFSCLSPDGDSKVDPSKRLSDVSEFGRFSMSPNMMDVKATKNGARIACSSAFAEIMDSHSRVSPKDIKDFNLRVACMAGLSSDEKEALTSSPLQLSKRSEEINANNRRSLDFSNIELSPVKQSMPIGISPMMGGDRLLPIHPLERKENGDVGVSSLTTNGAQRDSESIKREESERVPPSVNGKMREHRKSSIIHSQASMEALAQSPVGVKLGIMRPEDIIDSPAVKQATDAAVAAAMKANAEIISRGLQRSNDRGYGNAQTHSQSQAHGQVSSAHMTAYAAANAHAFVPSRRASRRESTNIKPKITPDAAALKLLYDGPIATENHGATKCKCKRSKCLKLYCECFKAKGYCGAECSCTCCQNKAGHEDQILEAREGILARNPLAFAEKIAETSAQDGDGKVGMSHTRGCNCKKSRCGKKYCECFQAGVLCTDHCKCTGCLNCVKSADPIMGGARKRRKTHSSRDDPSHLDVVPNGGAIPGLTPVTNPSLQLEED